MYKYNAELIRVIDGDTIVVYVDLGFNVKMKMTVRLYGINAPESRTRDLEEKKKGLATKRYVKIMLSKATNIQIHSIKDKKGKFGRYLAEVIYDNVNLNKQLVKLKMAKNADY